MAVWTCSSRGGLPAVAVRRKEFGGMLGRWRLLPEGAKQSVAVAFYSLLAFVDRNGATDFLNHGYAGLGETTDFVCLPDHLERHRYAIQSYHALAELAHWLPDTDVVEVSCGRGGGASYLFSAYQPRSLVGVDLARASIRAARRAYARPGLSFEIGDAQALPLADATCDIVLCVDSSSNYPSTERFLAEVDRILRPGGIFLFADFRTRAGMRRLQEHIDRLGFAIDTRRDVSANVARALRLDDARKQARIRNGLPHALQPLARAIMHAGPAATAEAERFERGLKTSFMLALRKPPAAAAIEAKAQGRRLQTADTGPAT